MAKQTINDVEVAGKRVLMRVDFNVPLDERGVITDDRRIRMALPSIRRVVDGGGRLVLMSHLGRPDGGPDPTLSLAPAARRLGELLGGLTVRFAAGDCVSAETARLVTALADGEILLLENLRFNPGEKDGDPAFAAQLAAYGDVYCNDAFGSAHRSDASMVAVPRVMSGRPRVAGLLLDKELRYLSEALTRPKHPFVAVLGGAKVSDKLGAIRNLTGRVDTILVGGAMAYTFLAAGGSDVGASRVETDMFDTARGLLDHGAVRIILPTDHVCGTTMGGDTPVEVFQDAIPQGWMGLDIGPKTCAAFASVLQEAATIVWNGPVGVFETPPFDKGSRVVAESIAQATAHAAVTVVGGGDTAAAVEAFGLADRITHVSTGGGASLRLLEGGGFESVELLDDA